MRHAANGNLEYIDPESVPYLGYLPQDVVGEDAIKLYHHDDLCYLRQVYETIVKEGGVPRCKPYRYNVILYLLVKFSSDLVSKSEITPYYLLIESCFRFE